MFRCAVLICSFLFITLTATAATEQALFAEALDAARNSDWQTLEKKESQLPEAHPLQAYLDFHRLRDALPGLDPAEIQRYRQRYPDSPLPNDITGLAQSAYGSAGNWSALLAISSSAPAPLERRCLYYRALKDRDLDSAMAASKEIWLSGQSRPASCDPLFDRARELGVINQDLVWQRLLLAYDSNSAGLMRYLQDMLKQGPYEKASNLLLELHRQPSGVTTLTSKLSDYQRQILLSAGLRRWAASDTIAARQWFAAHSKKAGLNNEALRARAAERIAWYSTIRGIDENRQWLDQWLAENGTDELLDQRARRAVIEQDWSGLLGWYQKLPQSEQHNARWLYWKARALEQNDGIEAARPFYQQAAEQRNFFAFMAADQLGQPYQFNLQPAPAAISPAPAAITRITLLLGMEETGAAWREWRWLLAQSATEQQHGLAQLALERGWYDLAVEASIQSGAWNTLDWRFPAAYQEDFLAGARKHNVDPWLAMAIARRESAFNPRAQSPAGALGVMQLMPGTARLMARDAGLPSPDQQALFDQELNIELGSRYLAKVLRDFNNNRILALAAYNAGPSRVNRWLKNTDAALPVDVWIEAIPFRETRDYVQAVLTYRALLVGMHTETERSALLLSPGEKNTPYSIVMLNGCSDSQVQVQQTC